MTDVVIKGGQHLIIFQTPLLTEHLEHGFNGLPVCGIEFRLKDLPFIDALQLILQQTAFAGHPSVRLAHIALQTHTGVMAIQTGAEDGEAEPIRLIGFVVAADDVGAVVHCIVRVLMGAEIGESDIAVQMIFGLGCLMGGKELFQFFIGHGTIPFL